ncbi:MAG: hypothetical protein MJ181_02615 [Treponema sp.]|nr:hypothetical protein [Treponema sp.]
MKKVRKIFALSLAAFMLLTVTACKNWMTGGLFDSIEEEVKVATADKIPVYVSTAASVMGKTVPEGESTQKMGVSFTVKLERIEPSYAFYKWFAFSTKDLEEAKSEGLGDKFPFNTQNPNRNFVLDDDFETRYMKYSEKLAGAVEIKNADKEEAVVTIKEVRDDIVIVPVCAARAVLNSDDTYPATLAYMLDQRAVRNQRVVLAFDKDMDFSTFVTCTNPSKTYEKDENDNNIYYIEKEDGDVEYFYDWDRSKIQISVYDTNKNLLSDDESYSFFKLPMPNPKDSRQIFITPDTQNKKLPKFAKIRITIAEEVKDSYGYKLESDIVYTYLVGASDDEGNPIFKLLSCGRPRTGLAANENTWSDYDGFMDAEGDLTTVLPEATTNINDWTSDLVSQTFAHRITDRIDVLVQIVDMVKEGVESTTASDNEIDHFTVRARHLVNLDGTPGTGAIYENIAEKNYDALIYHGGAKNFEDGEPGENCNDPDAGYAFPYYLPENIPDGLIKLEFFAVDITGNSGEETPYAIYVVKDTSAPDISSQASKIKSASVNTLNSWFNDRTIEALSFRADSSNKFVDTINVGTEENPVIHDVAPIFMSDGTNAKLFWNFGNSPTDMAGIQEIKYGEDDIYEMTNLVDFIKDQGVQGAMTFYAQVSDDLGNVSDFVKIPLEIYYDNQAPANTGILPPGSENGIYPETGIEKGSTLTEPKKYFTRDTSLSLTLSSVDADSATGVESAAATATSSGLAGFFVSESKYADVQAEALKVENGVQISPDFKKAVDGKSTVQFATGAENDTGKNYFLYSMDYALNPSEVPTEITVIQDTTGPGVEFTDNASYSYKAESEYFKELDDEADGSDDSDIALGTAGSENLSGEVKGVSKGIYYYNLSQDSFPIDVTIKNQHAGLDSGLYYFEVENAATGVKTSYGMNAAKATERTESVNLPEGTYKVIAYDNLGNKTVTETFTIVQDKSIPETGNFSIWGTKIVPEGENGYNSESTNIRTVDLVFSSDDTVVMDSSNTGIRKLILKGASFRQDNLVVKAGETVLVKNTDYLIQAAADDSEETYITFIRPRTETSYRIENVMLPEEDGRKYIYIKAMDASGNTNADWIDAYIDSDSQAPSISSVSGLASKYMLDSTGNRTYTNSNIISVEIKAHDKTSGIKQIYITDTASEVPNVSGGVVGNNTIPAGTKLIQNNSVVTVNGVERASTYENGMITLDSPVDTEEDVTIIVTNVRIPDDTKQGMQTVHVILFDNTGLRNESSKPASIVYDTTGPAIEVEDYASSTFDGITHKKYRSNDTASDILAVTGTTGRVNGLVSGDYFYNLEEGSASENPGFRFIVTIKDENITNNQLVADGSTSGIYKFYVDKVLASSVEEGTTAYNSGDHIYLTEGTYRIRALDNLENQTVSNNIHVKADNGRPVNVTDLVITGKYKDGVTPYSTATAIKDVKINFSAGDDESGKVNTGIYKITFSGDAVFANATLNVVTESNGVRTVTPLVKKTDGNSGWDYSMTAGNGTVQFLFREPVAERRIYEVQGVRLTDSDAKKTISISIADFTENESASDGTAEIFKDETEPVTSNVNIISTDPEVVQGENKLNVTNDEKVTVTFSIYDVTSGIKKITICDKNGNSLLTTGTDGSVITAVRDGNSVVLSATVSADAIVFENAGAMISETSFNFTVTNVSMPKENGDFVQGRNYFYVKAYDDVLNVASEAATGSIVFDNVPPKPLIEFAGSHFFDPKQSRKMSSSYSAYMDEVGKIFFSNSSYFYFKVDGGDDSSEGIETAGYAGYKVWYKTSAFDVSDPATYSGSKPPVSGDWYRIDNSQKYIKIFVYDAIGNYSTLVPGFTDFQLVDDQTAPAKVDYKIYKSGTNTEISDSFNDENPEADVVFKVKDTLSGISYFDFSDSHNSGDNSMWNQIISGSPDLRVEVSEDDGVTWKTYKEGKYDPAVDQHYSSVAGGATYDAEKGYFVDSEGNLDPYVYFHNYMENGKPFARCFAFYEPLKPNKEYTIKISNISFANNTKIRPSDSRTNWDSDIGFNIYVYDCVQKGCLSLEKPLVWDTHKPEIKGVEFAASEGYDPNFTSDLSLTKHDLVITYDEPKDSTYGGASGVKDIKLELTTNIGTIDLSTVNLLSSDNLKLYAKSGSSETALTIKEKKLLEASSSKTSSLITISSPSSTVKGSSYKLVIKGLTIAGGDVDMVENIKVTLTDFAGNVSDNTGNTNNVVEIGYDKTAPVMHPVYGNEVIDGKLARSYFKTVFGKPTVLSLHHATSNSDSTKIHNNSSIANNMVFNIFPEPGDEIQNYGDGIECPAPYSGTAWEDNADLTELVLRFNKNGSGVKSIKLAAEGNSVDSWDFRRILFNPSKVRVSIDEGQHWYSPGSSALPYTVTSDTLTFTNSGICPKGENCSVMIKGIMPNFKATYCRHNSDGDYRENIWWSDVVVTSFANKANTYNFALALADDVDTPELTRKKISVTDTSSTDTSFTDGETIQIKGRIQSKSTHKVYSSGLWAIQLSGAEFDPSVNPSFKAYISKPTGDYGRKLLLPNSVTYDDGDLISYSYDSTNDYSVRRTVDELTTVSKVDANPSQFKFSISSDKSTLYLNMPLDIDDTQDFTLSGIKLPSGVLDGNHDGAQNISLKLIKYSGLTNDPDDRYWDYDESNERDESYKTMFREVEAYYSATEEHRCAVNFAQNRTNSITLDTVDPVITWYDASDYNPNYFRLAPQDEQGRTVYYAGSSGYSYINFNFQDDSGIKGFAFTNTATAPTRPSDFYIANTQKYDIYYFNETNESLNVVKYIHVMDNTGHVTSRPVTYLASEDSVPTIWKVDNTKPSVKTVTRHYYGDTAETRYVLNLVSTDASSPKLNVYKGISDTLSGKFTDSYIEFDPSTQEYQTVPGDVNDFFEDSGSGLYGTCPTTQTGGAYFDKIYVDESGNPDFTWKTSDSYFKVMDKVGRGCEKSIGISSYVDSTAPILGISGITAPEGKSVYRASALSTDSTSPSVIYFNSTSAEDGVEITFSAKDTGENATGVYKVTVGGSGLASGADGASARLANAISLSTSATTVTWNLGKGEEKTEGEANGLLRSITITDWVGNATTYWFKLISDVTPPAVSLSSNSPFVESTDISVYMTSVDEENNKLNLYFSPTIYDRNNGSGSVDILINKVLTGLSDDCSGLVADKWYTDRDCSVEATKITLTQSFRNNRAQDPVASPAKFYAKDNVGNLLEFDVATKVNTVYYSSSYSLSIPYADGWYASNISEGKISFMPSTTTTLYLNGAKNTTFTVGDANGVKYVLKEGGRNKDSGNLGWGNGGYVDSFSYRLETGKTYSIELGSAWNQNLPTTTFTVQTVLDDTVPAISGTYVAAHTWEDSDGKRYYAGTDNGTVYISENGSVTIALGNELLSDAGSGIKGWYLNPTDRAESITLNKDNLEQDVFLVDNIGNYTVHKFSVTLDKDSPVYTPVTGSDLFAVHEYSAEEPYKVTAANKVIFTGDSLELSLPVISDSGSGLNGNWTVKTGTAVYSSVTNKITFTGTESVTLALYDNVNNETEVTVNAFKVGEIPALSLAKADSDIETGTFGEASYTVYTKADAAVFNVTKTNELAGFTTFKCGDDEISGNTLSLGNGNYVLKASDELGRETIYNLTVVVDQTAPDFTGNIVPAEHFWSEAEPYFAAAAGNSIVVNGKLASGTPVQFTLPAASDGDAGVGVDGWYESSTENGTYTKITETSVSVSGEKWLCLKDRLGNASVPFQFASVENTRPSLATGYEGAGSVQDGTNTYTAGKSVFTTWYSSKSYPDKWNGSTNFMAAGTKGGDEADTSHNNLVAAVVTETGSGIYQLILKTVAEPKVNWIGYMDPLYENGSIKYNDTTQIAGAQSSQAKYNPLNSVQIDKSYYIKGWSVQTSETPDADGTYTTVITLPLKPYVLNPTNGTKDDVNNATGTQLESSLKLSNNQYIFVFGKNIGNSLEVVDFAGNSSNDVAVSASVNTSLFGRFTVAITEISSKIPEAVGGTIRRAFTSNDRSEVKNERKARKAEKSTAVQAPVVTQTTEQTSKEGKKVLQNVAERAAELEAASKSAGTSTFRHEAEAILAAGAKVLPEIAEEAENCGISPEVNISENVVNSEKILANNGDEMYNNSNIAKSVVISIIAVLLLLCSLLVIIKTTKKQNEKK